MREGSENQIFEDAGNSVPLDPAAYSEKTLKSQEPRIELPPKMFRAKAFTQRDRTKFTYTSRKLGQRHYSNNNLDIRTELISFMKAFFGIFRESALSYKDLIELANRKSTYLIRLGFASFICFFFAYVYFTQLTLADFQITKVFGYGKMLFRNIVTFLSLGIAIFVPALVVDAIAVEREKNTLSLLLCSLLKPWDIVVQKLFGRLVPIFGIILISLPLLAIAYSLGGISLGYLLNGALSLTAMTLVVGTCAIKWSSTCETVGKALIFTYISIAIYLSCLLIIMSTKNAFFYSHYFILNYPLIAYFLISARNKLTDSSKTQKNFERSGAEEILNATISDLSMMAPENFNAEISMKEESSSISSRLLNFNFQLFLFWAVLLTEFPVLFLSTVFLGQRRLLIENPVYFSFFIFLNWIIAAVIIFISSVTIFIKERHNQTLETLLTSPLKNVEILNLKTKRLWFVVLVLFTPFVFLILLKALVQASLADTAFYLIATLPIYFIIMLLAASICLWFGMKIKKGQTAFISCFIFFLTWISLPLITRNNILLNHFIPSDAWQNVINFLSPSGVIIYLEHSLLEDSFESKILKVLSIFLAYSSAVIVLRQCCSYKLGKYLGRT